MKLFFPILCFIVLFSYQEEGNCSNKSVTQGSEVTYTIEKRPKKLFVGLELRTNNAECAVTMPAHKKRFFKENILAKIPQKIDGDILALYTDYEGDLAFETTAAGTNYVRHLKTAKSYSYEISITFLWLSAPEEAIKRVIERVKQGGHSVSKESIVRRYYLGIKNFMNYYLPLADEALIINNSSEGGLPKRIIARKDKNNRMQILEKASWEKMEQFARE